MRSQHAKIRVDKALRSLDTRDVIGVHNYMQTMYYNTPADTPDNGYHARMWNLTGAEIDRRSKRNGRGEIICREAAKWKEEHPNV